MAAVTSLAFPGALHADPADKGLRAEFSIDAERITIQTDQGEAFVFGHSDVVTEFYDTRTVRLSLAAGELYFRADDPLRFDSEVMPVLRGAAIPEADTTADLLATETPEPEAVPPAADLHSIDGPPRRSRKRGGMRFTPEQREMRRAAAAAAAAEPDPFVATEPQPRRRRAGHQHSWRDLQLAGGLTRRVCTTCHQVSIA